MREAPGSGAVPAFTARLRHKGGDSRSRTGAPAAAPGCAAEIDRESITPMYVQLASALRERIRRGETVPGVQGKGVFVIAMPADASEDDG